jgi:hypothetical protein
MKILLCISLAVFLSTNSSFAKIWRVKNNAGANAIATLAAAQDTATNGDTIHVEASATAYASITIRKKLIIIGPGYFLGDNPNTQATKQNAVVNGLTLYAGGSGSVIMGLDFNGNNVSVYASDVVIRRNKFSSVNGTTYDYSTGSVTLNTNYEGDNAPVRNIIISQNYGVRIDVNSASTGLLISNNYLSYYAYAGDNTAGTALNLHANAIAIIQNNIIRRGKLVANNSSIINNIMYVGTFEGTGNLVSNNIGNATQFGTANGNKSNVDMATVFIGSGTDISPDGQWKLAASSPAIAAGYGSTTQNPVDAGIYSGQTPYILSGIPPIPAIYAFENKPIGSNTDPITVTIKVKSNN